MEKSFIDPGKAVAFTGYRPEKLLASAHGTPDFMAVVQSRLIACVHRLAAEGYTTFLSGMAEGFDLMAARVVLLARSTYPDIELICVLPYPGQSRRFSPFWKTEHREIRRAAESHVAVSARYYNGVYDRRNEFLVDHCSRLVTWFDGQPGGTAYTVELATRSGVPIMNLCLPSSGSSV